MFICKKNCLNSLVPLRGRRGGGVKAIAKCPAKNASFFDVLPKLPKSIVKLEPT